MFQLTEFVARLKGWQVFLVLIVSPVAFQMFTVSTMLSPGVVEGTMTIDDFPAMFRRMMMITALMISLMVLWLLSVGLASNRRLPAATRPTTLPATAAALWAVGYGIAAGWLFPAVAAGTLSPVAVFVPHILAMVSMFFLLLFAARNLVRAEAMASDTSGSSAGAFFLLWFFPVGVWFIQPRLNRVVASGPP